MALRPLWQQWGLSEVADLPNGFYLIKCDSHEMTLKLLFGGPWTINGMILQLAPWHEFFQPTFESLTTAAVWIQLHHLPVELWDQEALELITSHFGKLLKIDETTVCLSRARFARVYVEIDLSQPLKRGV